MISTNNVTNYDYDDLRKKITDRLKDKEGWGDGYESSVGQNLIDIAADAADILSYMLERRSQESFQSTARLRSSVAAKASELGYRSRRASASNGTLTLTLTDENGNPKPVETGGLVTISEGEEVTFDRETFIVTADYVIEEGMSSVDIEVTQGVREIMEVYPEGEPTFQDSGYVLIPNYEYIDNNNFRVVSDNVEYQDVEVLDSANGVGIGSLSFSPARTGDERSAYYDIRYAQDGMRVQFGDDLFGMKPENLIEISYIRTDGERVRVLSLNNNFRFNFDTFSDGINVVPENEYEYTLTNKTQIIGGRPPETLSDIRKNAPLYLTTNNRAVSLEGYSYWAKRSGVADIIDARAFSESEIDTLIYNMNNIYIAYLTETGGELLPIEKQELIDFVKERDVALAHIIPQQANEIKLGIELHLKKNPKLQIGYSDLYLIVRDFLMNYFKRRDGSIGREYQKSDLIRDFYDLETRVNGVDFRVTDFVDIDIHAFQEAVYPLAVEEVLVRLDNNGTTATVGDVFSLNIDGVQHSVTVEQSDLDSGEFYANMLFKMRDQLYLETELISDTYIISDGTNSDYVLNIKSRDKLGSFIIQADSGNFSQDTSLNFSLQIYPRQFNNEFDDILLRKGVFVTDENGQVLYYDNGEGFWIDKSTGNVVLFDSVSTGNPVQSEMIDYVTAKLTLPELPQGTYYVKYKQDRYDNFDANSASAVTLIPPKETYEDTVETFSVIDLIQV